MKKIKLEKLGLGLCLAGLLSVPSITSAAFVYNVDFGSVNNGTVIEPGTDIAGVTDYRAFQRLDVGTKFGPANAWTVGDNNVDYITGLWQSPNGSYSATGARPNSVDLEGGGDGGSISRQIDVGSGGLVTINFSITGNPDHGTGVKSGTISVSLGGAVQNLTYTVTGANSRANMDWIAESATFLVTGTGSQTLTFAGTGPNSGYGLVIGSAVPEPTTVIAGFGALGLLLFGAGVHNKRSVLRIGK
jgi:hypothetical protein